MLFPNLSNFEPGVTKLLNDRSGNNREVSEYMPWLRIASAYNNGLILESINSSNAFVDTYGDSGKSGRVGVDFGGNNVYAFSESVTTTKAGKKESYSVQRTPETDRRFRPSPTIDALSLTFGAGGLSRKTNFSIKAFTLKQAETLQKYFAEPGYTVLVEYGWNHPKSLQQKASLTLSNGACEMAKYNNFIHVKEKEQNSDYKYSGYLGFITKSGLKNSEGETYILDVELTTIGEIPAFLQQHKGGDVDADNKPKGGLKFSKSKIKAQQRCYANGIDYFIGRSLFMQMFNRLPQEKQTQKVKNLLEVGKDSRGKSWAHKGNFINMDEKIRETLTEKLEGQSINSKKNDYNAKIPSGIQIFDTSSFIRLELAFEILNSYAVDLTERTDNAPPCSGVKPMNFKIETNYTLCRGFKHMFSTDVSKVFIPNRNTPAFDLIKALSSTSEVEGNSPFLSIKNGVPEETADLDQFDIEDDMCFPQVKPLNEYKWPDGTITQDFEAHTYGYLKDLFVNFEFFCEVLGRNNVVIKDIYLELLNGIASAVDNYWYFEIAQTPNKQDADNQLEVYDNTLCSPDRSLFDECPKFVSSGVDTPFLTSNFDMDLPAAMKNSIIGQRNSTSVNTNSDGATNVKLSNIFNVEQDPVLSILNSFKPEKEPADETGDEEETPDEDEIRKANFELFLQYGKVITGVKDRNGDYDITEGSTWINFNTANAEAESVLLVAGWTDRALFKLLSKATTESSTNVLIPISFEFETFGITGIVTGQIFKIKDLPAKFKQSAFQVVEVGHELGGGLWKTKVKGKLRNFS